MLDVRTYVITYALKVVAQHRVSDVRCVEILCALRVGTMSRPSLVGTHSTLQLRVRCVSRV